VLPLSSTKKTKTKKNNNKKGGGAEQHTGPRVLLPLLCFGIVFLAQPRSLIASISSNFLLMMREREVSLKED
jgi:hypothetical protein